MAVSARPTARTDSHVTVVRRPPRDLARPPAGFRPPIVTDGSGPAAVSFARGGGAPPEPPPLGVPRTRTSAAWFGIWAGVVVLILLIIFVAQNTDPVEITFLWMHGTLPLALALLIAGVAVAVVAMGIAAARIAQLRRLLRRRG